VPHDPRDLGRGIVKLGIADQIGLAARDQLLLDIGQRHHLRELLRLAAGAQADIDGHVVAGLPVARIDIDPPCRINPRPRWRRFQRLADAASASMPWVLLADAGAGFQFGIEILHHRIDRYRDVGRKFALAVPLPMAAICMALASSGHQRGVPRPATGTL
jgi:hypothetical protein